MTRWYSEDEIRAAFADHGFDEDGSRCIERETLLCWLLAAASSSADESAPAEPSIMRGPHHFKSYGGTEQCGWILSITNRGEDGGPERCRRPADDPIHPHPEALPSESADHEWVPCEAHMISTDCGTCCELPYRAHPQRAGSPLQDKGPRRLPGPTVMDQLCDDPDCDMHDDGPQRGGPATHEPGIYPGGGLAFAELQPARPDPLCTCGHPESEHRWPLVGNTLGCVVLDGAQVCPCPSYRIDSGICTCDYRAGDMTGHRLHCPVRIAAWKAGHE